MYFLGKAKSVQYFGFLPFFEYLDLLLTVILHFMGDSYRSIIVLVSTLYFILSHLLTYIMRVGISQSLNSFFYSTKMRNNTPNNATYVKPGVVGKSYFFGKNTEYKLTKPGITDSTRS